MSETVTPTPFVAVGLALATTAFGVFVEKHYVSKWSVLSNCASVGSLSLSLSSSQYWLLAILVAYAIAGGILVASKKSGKIINGVKHLFGSKIYGSIAIAFAFYDLEGSFFSRWLLGVLKSWGFPDWFDGNIIAFSWMIIITLVIIASIVVYFKTKKKSS